MPLLRIKAPYASTDKDPDSSVAQINKMLRQYGISDYQWTTLWDQGIIELRFVIESVDKGVARKTAVKVQPPTFKATRRTWNAAKGKYEKVQLPNYPQALRLLYWWLKVKIEAVAYGLREVQEEFLSDMIVRLPNGQETTVGKVLKPQLTQGPGGVPEVPALDRTAAEEKDQGAVIDAEWKEGS